MFKPEVYTFLQVADSDSWSEAARRLNLNSGTVRVHISRLEDMLGVKLVTRMKWGFKLTRVGRYVYDELDGMSHDMELMKTKALRMQAQLDASSSSDSSASPDLL